MSNPSLVENEPLLFQTKLHTLIDANLAFCLPRLLENQATDEQPISPAQLKKAARLELSLRLTSETIGFLHASMIQIDGKNYLLAGESGVGKSTYAQALIEHFGGEILANDWVGIERGGDDFFVSDLNLAEQIKHPERCCLDGLIFLTKEDPFQRDAFSPNEEEFACLLTQTFDTATAEELAILKKFWLKNRDSLKQVIAVPTRQKSQAYVAETLNNLIERQKMTYDRVGVIGLGAIGAELASQLGQMEQIRQVNLYNRTPDKAIGYALDMNQGVVDKGEVYLAHQDATQVFANSDAVFLCFRDPQGGSVEKNLPERWGKAAAHAAVMAEYARIASVQNFQGTIFVVTNPVDLLTFALYEQSQHQQQSLRTYQVYGVGLELDRARALYYAQQLGFTLKPEQLEIFGNHSDTPILRSPLPEIENNQLQQAVTDASPAIRKYVPRTVYGPVAAVKNALLALSANGDSALTTIQNNSFIGRPIQFEAGLPKFGSSDEEKIIAEILLVNQSLSLK